MTFDNNHNNNNKQTTTTTATHPLKEQTVSNIATGHWTLKYPKRNSGISSVFVFLSFLKTFNSFITELPLGCPYVDYVSDSQVLFQLCPPPLPLFAPTPPHHTTTPHDTATTPPPRPHTHPRPPPPPPRPPPPPHPPHPTTTPPPCLPRLTTTTPPHRLTA